MTCDGWDSFIQVNIYGRTLQELNKQGIVLESLLNDVGCSNVWIVEGSMYNSGAHRRIEDVDQRRFHNEKEVTLSTTLATVQLPRHSTPAPWQPDLERRFTLNLPQNYSTIDSDYEEEFMFDGDTTENNEVQAVLMKIIEHVVGNENQADLSTTITKTNIPRISTPIASQVDLLKAVTLNIPEILSEINSDEEDESVCMDDEEQSKESEKSEKNMRVKENVKQEGNSSDKNRASLKRSISEVEALRDGCNQNFNSKSSRKCFPLKKSFPLQHFISKKSARRNHAPSVSSAPICSDGKFRSMSVPSRYIKVVEASSEPQKKKPTSSQIIKTVNSFPISRQVSPNSQSSQFEQSDGENNIPREYQDYQSDSLKDYSFEMNHSDDFIPVANNEVVIGESDDMKPIVNSPGLHRLTSHDFPNELEALGEVKGETVALDVDTSVEYKSNIVPTSFEYDNVDYEVNFFSASEGDDTAVMVIEDDEAGKFTPPPLNQVSTKSILKPFMKGSDDVDDKMKKAVSFGVPKNKLSAKQKKLDESHQIKCHYEGCEKVYTWKIRYGKQRLLDHAMAHINDKCLACKTCDVPFSTSRQIAYHYKREHPEMKSAHFNIIEVFNLELDDVAVSDLFNKCFGHHSAIVGKVDKLRRTRTQRGKKEKKNGENQNEANVKEDDDDKDIPGPSGLFYFRRIH